MIKITCPKCGNFVIAVTTDTIVEIKGVADPARCEELRKRMAAGDDVADMLDCDDMEAAVEAIMTGRSSE